MKINWITILLLFLLILNAAMFGTFLYRQNNPEAIAEPPALAGPQSHGGRHAGMGRFFYEALDLTHKQHRELKNARRTFHQNSRHLHDSLKHTNRAFLHAMTTNPDDTAALHNLAQTIGALHSNLRWHTYQYYLDMRAVCTPEQTVKLDSVLIQAIDKELFMRKFGQNQKPHNHFKYRKHQKIENYEHKNQN